MAIFRRLLFAYTTRTTLSMNERTNERTVCSIKQCVSIVSVFLLLFLLYCCVQKNMAYAMRLFVFYSVCFYFGSSCFFVFIFLLRTLCSFFFFFILFFWYCQFMCYLSGIVCSMCSFRVKYIEIVYIILNVLAIFTIILQCAQCVRTKEKNECFQSRNAQ